MGEEPFNTGVRLSKKNNTRHGFEKYILLISG